MINNVVLVGNLTRDPELRKTQTGKSVISFSLAVKRNFGGQDGQDTDFINCVAWNQTADFMANYTHKGDQLGVSGNIQTGSYEDKDGRKVYTTDVNAFSVQALESKDAKELRISKQGGGQGYQGQGNVQYDNDPDDYVDLDQETFGGPTLDISDEDLPF